MESFFIDYRDPLFGVIVLFAIIFVISFANYWWGVFKRKEEKQSIERFVKKFEIVTDENEYKKLLEDASIPLESLALLAHAYAKSGDFEKAINIYLVALKRVKGKEEKQYLLSTLGKTYFKAGFLRRSAEVFLESLRLHPRNEASLKYLTVVYEQLQEFERAAEVLDALEELGAEVALQRLFLRFLAIQKNEKLSITHKIEALKPLCDEAPFLKRALFEWMHASNTPMDDAMCESLPIQSMIDLLWYLPHRLPTCHPILKSIAMAKGEMPFEAVEGVPFGLEALARLRVTGYEGATLSFEYLCTSCKQLFPIHFYRCPHCQSIATLSIQTQIVPISDEENNSFL